MTGKMNSPSRAREGDPTPQTWQPCPTLRLDRIGRLEAIRVLKSQGRSPLEPSGPQDPR